MKLFRLVLAVIFIVAFTMIACSDDETPTSTEGTGSPPSGTDASNVCDGGRCADSPAAKQQCEIFLEQCLTYAPNESDCVGGAWVICNSAP
jgi:hypothetical protein